MSEAELQKAVIELAHRFGWRAVHFRPGKTKRGNWITAVQGDGVGWPDLILVRERVVFAELKAEKGKLDDAQKQWLAALEVAGAEVWVLRPEHWHSGVVEGLLRGRQDVAA